MDVLNSYWCGYIGGMWKVLPLPSNVSREYEGIDLFQSQSINDLVVTEVIMALLFNYNVFSG